MLMRIPHLSAAGQRRALWLPMRFRSRLRGLLNGCAEILFLSGPAAGLILVTISLLNPRVGLGGLVSVAAALLFARLGGIQGRFRESGAYVYNPMLTGLCVGFLLGIQPLGLFVAAAAGVLAFALSVTLNGIFADYLRLPALSLPFVIVSALLWLGFPGRGPGPVAVDTGAGLVQAAAAWQWLPPWIDGMLTSLGAILFTPHPAAGLAIAVLILRHSRILFALAVGGYLIGTSVGQVLTGGEADVFTDLNHFNHMLIAMALGGVFLVPSLRSYAVAAVAVVVSGLLLTAAQPISEHTGVPVFTLPFNLITLTFLYVLGRTSSPLMARVLKSTPEETLDDHLSRRKRFGDPRPELRLPFSGAWTLWQGFDGPWTHTGPWRYACDFIITRHAEGFDAAGEGSVGYRDYGLRLEDYHAWRKPVLAPCGGRVVLVLSELPDNPPGHVDKLNRWGNLVVIESAYGWFAELSHFAKDSIVVREGDQVEPGQLLGLCGNSGYSAQPHVHLQVQASARIGAATLPFRFVSFRESNRFSARGLPRVGDQVQPLVADRSLQYRAALPLGETLRYRVGEGGVSEGTMELVVRMDELGQYFLDSGKGQLYFALDPSGFYFYRMDGNDPWLAVLFQALPHLPLGYERGMTWSDSVPLAVLERGWRRRLIELFRSFWHGAGRNRFRGCWVADGVVEGQLSRAYATRARKTRVVLSQRMGFSEVRVGDRFMFLEGEKER